MVTNTKRLCTHKRITLKIQQLSIMLHIYTLNPLQMSKQGAKIILPDFFPFLFWQNRKSTRFSLKTSLWVCQTRKWLSQMLLRIKFPIYQYLLCLCSHPSDMLQNRANQTALCLKWRKLQFCNRHPTTCNIPFERELNSLSNPIKYSFITSTFTLLDPASSTKWKFQSHFSWSRSGQKWS